MARGNSVFLCGYVIDHVATYSTEKELRSRKIYMNVYRRTYVTSDYHEKGNSRWDRITVYSRNPEMIEKMGAVRDGDIILVKGTFCSLDFKRKYECKKCGDVKYKAKAVTCYVDPLDIVILKSQDQSLWRPTDEKDFRLVENEAKEYVKLHREISNQIYIFGTLCREPADFDFYEPEGRTGTPYFQFRIGSKRIRYIREDGPDKADDWLHVKVYGEKAEECRNALHHGSTVYIDGAIQSRDVDMKVTCEECGNTYLKRITTMEIVPYHIEFVDKCELLFTPIDVSDFEEDS